MTTHDEDKLGRQLRQSIKVWRIEYRHAIVGSQHRAPSRSLSARRKKSAILKKADVSPPQILIDNWKFHFQALQHPRCIVVPDLRQLRNQSLMLLCWLPAEIKRQNGKQCVFPVQILQMLFSPYLVRNNAEPVTTCLKPTENGLPGHHVRVGKIEDLAGIEGT